jgi:putative ABC transport system permease protein
MIPFSYNVRSLTVRKTSTLVTAFGVALVVFVLAGAMMLVAGIEKTLAVGGRVDNAVVLSNGSDDELTSNIDDNVTRTIGTYTGVKTENGKPLMIAETMIVALMHLKDGVGITNVLMRGIVDGSAPFRPEVKMVSGRPPKPGTDEVMIGKRLEGRFESLDLGNHIELKKNRPALIVGVFEAAGSAYESEIWVDRDVLRTIYGRQDFVSSVHVRLTSPEAFDGFAAAVKSDRTARGLLAEREPDFLARQGEGLTTIVGGLGGAVSFFLAIAAMIGAMVTMYSAVASRQREIGTLRALGFGRGSILLSFLLEATLLTVLGGAIGLFCAMGMRFATFSMVGNSWAEVVFSFDPTPAVLLRALGAAVFMGLIGGLFPAIRAARTSPVTAMRG